MIYQIYVDGSFVSINFSFEDAMFYIWDRGLSIIEEEEVLDENTVKIYCEDRN